MRVRARGGLVLAALVAVLLPGGSPDAAPGRPTTYWNPVVPLDFPDPFVLADGPLLHAYATNGYGANIQVLSSPDGVTWTAFGDVLPRLPGWAAPDHTWAPSVLKVGTRYVLYFTARHRTAGIPCIGAATGLSPRGPFSDPAAHPVMCQPDRGGSIDPSPFVERDGSRWLLWKSEGVRGREPTRLWSQRLDASGTKVTGQAALLLTQDLPWESPIIENPSMVRFGNRLLVLYSAGRWQDRSYSVGWGACASPAGPCTKSGEQLLRSSGAVAGPGGQEVFRRPDGSTWISYHAWSSDRVGYPRGARSLRIDKLALLGDRPFVAGPTAWPTSMSGVPTAPGVAITSNAAGDGYRVTTGSGSVHAFGGAADPGSSPGPTVEAAATRSGGGLYLATPDGRIRTAGDALPLPTSQAWFRAPTTAIATHPSGAGVWLVSEAGEVHAAGDALHHGDLGRTRLAAPVVDIAPTATGRGYWLAAADGGVFAFGDAVYLGGAVGQTRSPVTGIAQTNGGYWLSTADGGVWSYGLVGFFGSAARSRHPAPIVDIAAHPLGGGYWLLASDGAVFAFGRSHFHGSSPLPR
jgi:hypothetical protein